VPELTVEADIDSLMTGVPAADKDTNFGSHIRIIHAVEFAAEAKSVWRRGIGNFNVSALTGLTINSAKLVRKLRTVNNGGQQSILSRCTRPADWVEDEVTWNDYSNGNAWTDEGGDYDDDGPPAALTYTEPSSIGTHEIAGLKEFVQDALDNRDGIVSLITRLSDENPEGSSTYTWNSKEEGADIWRLVIDYTPPAVPNPGRRGIGPSPFARGAPAIRPARVARPARTASGVAPARPHQPGRTA
jgi:hypothetical protein